MRLICPSCGAIASAEAWENDASARRVLDIVSKLPGAVAVRALPYLGLFRQGKKRVLAWPTAVKLASDLAMMVGYGTVQWDGGEERPAPPELWARLMDQMIGMQKSQQQLNHNYLRKAVWSEAKELAEKAEAEHSRSIRDRGRNEVPEEDTGSEAQRPRGCYQCAAFKPPKGCREGRRPTGGNMVLGCDGWTAKQTSASEVMSGIAAAISKMPQE